VVGARTKYLPTFSTADFGNICFRYDEGKLLKKHRSWEDFISCAEYLVMSSPLRSGGGGLCCLQVIIWFYFSTALVQIEEGYTQPKLLAAHASSAGGLVLGVVANQRSLDNA
jgi:hypothetical protein